MSESNTVTLEIEVDTTGASEQQLVMYREMATLFEQRFELFVNKNLDYNSSFLSAGEVDMVLDSGDGPFDSAMDANLYKLFTRIQDKSQRFYSLVFCNNGDHVGESAGETAGDAMVYWAMINWLITTDRNV